MMKIRTGIILLVVIAVAAFLAGQGTTLLGGKQAQERKVLYYVDPMNPAFRSDKPGIAPCGMPLEPVYADSAAPAGAAPPGTIRISPEKQQLMGVRTATVEKAPWTHTIRVLGRVAPDETRIYRINAAVSGWIEEVSQVTTGSLVKKNDLLATSYSLEYRALFQNYMSLAVPDHVDPARAEPGQSASRYTDAQLRQMRKTVQTLNRGTYDPQMEYYRRNLENYGISEQQIKEMQRTRRIPDIAEIRSPISGFILTRNISPGLRFDRGLEFFRIADLSQVWILADTFENEAAYFKPGATAKIDLPYARKSLHARISKVLPQFDPATRTLRIRLVADNPGFIMRPDMFVYVELSINGPPAIIVPVDAVLSSGLKKTVFVDLGNGIFEPRQVETGKSLGERVEIVRGLMPGEKIAVAGNFLIDSEARMQQTAAGIHGSASRDPVCGMNVDEGRASAEKHVLEYKGTTYYFCSIECRDEFAKNPAKYTGASQAPAAMPGTTSQKQVKNHKDHGDMPTPEPSKASGGRDPHGDMSMPSRYGGRGEVQPDAGRDRMRMPPAAAPAEMPMSPVTPVPAINPMTGNTPQPKGSGILMQPGSPAMPGPSPGTAVAPMPGRPVMGPPSMKAPVPGGIAIPGAPSVPAMKTPKPGGTAAAMPGTSPKGPSPPGADEREDDHD